MSSAVQATADVSQEKFLSSRSFISMHAYPGLDSIRPTSVKIGRRLFGPMKLTFTLETIGAASSSHVARVKNTLTNAWFRSSSSHLCASWCGDASWKGGRGHWLYWSTQEGREEE